MRILALLLIVSTMSAADIQVVPGYASASVYLWEGNPSEHQLEYREADGEWRPGLSLCATASYPTMRTSILGLTDDTAYEVRVLAAGEVVSAASFRTLSSHVPVARTVKVDSAAPIEIREQGTADGWIRITADQPVGGIRLDNAAYVILDGLTIAGGVTAKSDDVNNNSNQGIHLLNSHHVQVINCDISGWGRVGEQDFDRLGVFIDPKSNKPINRDGGIFVDQSEDVLIERCYIHDPVGRSVSWAYTHPAGPEAIYMHAKGRVTIRYNDLIGSSEHPWNDVIEGHYNGFPHGGFHRDAEIYGNLMVYGNDDGIELDGGQMNVRCWGNRIEGTLCGISTAPCLLGPSFIFDNVIARLGDENGQSANALKNGYRFIGEGAILFANNTTIDVPCAMNDFGAGKGDRRRLTSRNNVLTTTGSLMDTGLINDKQDLEHDLLWSTATSAMQETLAAMKTAGVEVQATVKQPMFQPDSRLTPDSPGAADSVLIPGISQAGDPLGVHAATPIRPMPLVSDRSFLQLADAPVTVTLTWKGDSPTAFSIRQNRAFGWLTVTPASGTLTPNKPLTLSVAVTPALGWRRGAFQVALPDGYTLPVIVHAGVYQPTMPDPRDTRIVAWLEGEAYANPEHPAREEAGASSGKALWFAGADDRTFDPKRTIEMSFTVPKDGRYFLAVRFKGEIPVGSHNSFFLSIDGDDPQRPLDFRGTPEWSWCGLSRMSGKSRTWFQPYTFTAGEHRLTLAPREDLLLDCILVLTDPRCLYPTH